MMFYQISPTVIDDGTPAWTLVRYISMSTPFGCYTSSKVLATNTDKQVLETAIAHLQGAAPTVNSADGSQP